MVGRGVGPVGVRSLAGAGNVMGAVQWFADCCGLWGSLLEREGLARSVVGLSRSLLSDPAKRLGPNQGRDTKPRRDVSGTLGLLERAFEE